MISSVRWPDEMALWTIYEAAGTKVPADFWGQLTDTPSEEIQKNYVRTNLQGRQEFSNGNGIDFLIHVGKTMKRFFTDLKSDSLNHEDCQKNLKKAVKDLCQIEQRVLERFSFFPKELKFSSQLETAHKVILVFQRLQEKLPIFFQKRHEYAARVQQSRKMIAQLESQFSQEIPKLHKKLDQLKKELEKIKVSEEKSIALNTAESRVNLLKEEFVHFSNYFSGVPLREIPSHVEYEEILEGFDEANKDLERCKSRISPESSPSKALTIAADAIVTIKKIVYLIKSYRERLNTEEATKQKYKEKFSLLPKNMEKEFFSEISQIKVASEENEDEELMFAMDKSPVSLGLVLLNPSLCSPSSYTPTSPAGVGIDISPVNPPEPKGAVSLSSECTSDLVVDLLEEDTKSIGFEPKLLNLTRKKFPNESILLKRAQDERANERFERECREKHKDYWKQNILPNFQSQEDIPEEDWEGVSDSSDLMFQMDK